MRIANFASLLFALLTRMASAQASPLPQDIRGLSARWAEYYAADYQVPVDFVMAIIDEESGGYPCAISEKGAVGLMQLMRQTSVRFGVRNRFRVDEYIRGGVAYLSWLNHEF